MREQGTQRYVDHLNFVCGGETYHFTVQQRLNESGRGKAIYVGSFFRNEGTMHENVSLPQGLEYETLYCLKEAIVHLPISESSYPQQRQFWDFFPFEGDNLRCVLALNDDAVQMSEQIIDGRLNPFGAEETQLFRCAVIEPVYAPFKVDDFPTFREKFDCLLQIVAGLKQLMACDVLQRYQILAHRDLKFKNVMVEHRQDGTRRLRIIDFPSVKFHLRDAGAEETHTRLGFLSVENTAPEDVKAGYAVSPKTDVFALGMMLAELFKIWDYEGEKNPLSLLFNLASGLDPSDTQTCRDFYERMDKWYPYQNADMAGWLEQALARHDKNAGWHKIERVCPGIRTLFRQATAIDPKHRITLLNFEKELRRMQNGLPIENAAFEVEAMANEEKTVYFLVDTTQKDQFCTAYISVMQEVLAGAAIDTKAAVLTYKWEHIANTLYPDPSLFEMNTLYNDQLPEYIRRLPQSEAGSMDVSTVKQCLHNVLVYLQNQTNRSGFNGEIHIFAPEAPTNENTNRFVVHQKNFDGTVKAVVYGGAELIEAFAAEGDRVYVHTFDDGAAKREKWYTLVPLPGERPVVEEEEKELEEKPAQAEVAETKPSESEQKIVHREAGTFRLIGGRPVNKFNW